MLCRFCKGPIGPLRWLKDNEFCCPEHRAAMRVRSARKLREQEYEQPDENAVVASDAIPAKVHKATGRETSTPLFLLAMAAAIGLGAIVVPMFTSQQTPIADALPAKAVPPKPPIHGFRGFIRRHAAVRLASDFRDRSDEWVPVADNKGKKDGWSFSDGFARPGRFRIWQPSQELTDYQLEFAGQIEKKALNWGWRAADEKNFYGTRLVVTKPGPLPEVQLVRFARVDGLELKRHSMRLPMNVRSDTVYKVNVTLKGSDITTAVNDLIVDTWTDEHFSSGGVAFYAAESESALLRYVTVTQRDTVLGRVLAYLGIIHPVRIPLVAF